LSLFKELKRRNVFKVAAAYIIVGWLIMQAGDTMAPALHLPEWVNSLLAFFLILGFPLAMFFSWAYEMTPDGIKKEIEIDRSKSTTHLTSRKLDFMIIGVLAVALMYFAWDKFLAGPAPDVKLTQTAAVSEHAITATASAQQIPDNKSIAVLPFVNMSSDPEQEYFSDGITEEVLNLLAKIPQLKVTSRSSAFSFKGQNIDIPTVARKLNVAHVLEGSVRKSGNRVRITTQLIEADTDVHMWSETYDRELDDIFAIQDEIALKVVNVLKLQLVGDTSVSRQTDTSAYTAYLQGEYFFQQTRMSELGTAHDAFRQALAIDPDYAPAWVGLGKTLRAQANNDVIDLIPGTQAAREAVLKALQLDESLAPAWAILAYIQWVYDWDWDAASNTIKTALIHGPQDIDALGTASVLAKTLGQYEEAAELGKKAIDVDPLNADRLNNLGIIYTEAGQLDLAVQTFEHTLKLYPQIDRVAAQISVIRSAQGRGEEALRLAQTERVDAFQLQASALAYLVLGREQEATQTIETLIDNFHKVMAYQIAGFFAFQGKPDEAFTWLETAFEQRDGGITHILGDPLLKSLHEDSRWEPYLLKLGLLDYWKTLQAKLSESTS